MVLDAQTPPGTPPPSQRQDEVSFGSLWSGILGAPIIWMGLELTAAICSTGPTAITQAHNDDVWRSLLPINVIAGVLELFAAGVAVHNWRKTRHRMSSSTHDLLEVGEGRTHFLTMIGVITRIGFLIALIFSGTTLLLVQPCK